MRGHHVGVRVGGLLRRLVPADVRLHPNHVAVFHKAADSAQAGNGLLRQLDGDVAERFAYPRPRLRPIWRSSCRLAYRRPRTQPAEALYREPGNRPSRPNVPRTCDVCRDTSRKPPSRGVNPDGGKFDRLKSEYRLLWGIAILLLGWLGTGPFFGEGDWLRGPTRSALFRVASTVPVPFCGQRGQSRFCGGHTRSRRKSLHRRNLDSPRAP